MVVVNPGVTALILRLQTGTDAKGAPVVRDLTIRGVKAGAAPENLYAAAEGIAGLQIYPLYRVDRLERGELVQQ
ncbi:MAG: DUF1659 domain-containing protein [Alicyclobacillaceae bacterium]|nr:DUF1659 domain-containing protein [Alicyclobacillaceae bacterium]